MISRIVQTTGDKMDLIRIRVFREGRELMLRREDVTTERLATVFKVKNHRRSFCDTLVMTVPLILVTNRGIISRRRCYWACRVSRSGSLQSSRGIAF